MMRRTNALERRRLDIYNGGLGSQAPFLDTPDFAYIFEETVKLPEFDLYHMGLGLYRFEKPLACSSQQLRQLRERYPSLEFIYWKEPQQAVLLFVRSGKYRTVHFRFFEHALMDSAFAAVIPRGYDEDLDQILSGGRVDKHIRICSCGDGEEKDDRLLGFRWEPHAYYDAEGRKLYIMMDGYVGKLIMDSDVYAFQGVRVYDLYEPGYDYPIVGGVPCYTIYTEKHKRCAVMGNYVADVGITIARICVRYIAFDDIGVDLLKSLYQYTAGYQYKELEVTDQRNAEPDSLNFSDLMDDGNASGEQEMAPSYMEQKLNYENIKRKYEQVLEEKKASFEMDSGAMELAEGIGYQNIFVYYRIMYHRDNRAARKPRQYAYAYFLPDGHVRFVDITSDATKIYAVPVSVFAELYVVERVRLCEGVWDEILVQVIDNTDIEESTFGWSEDCRKNFWEFLAD